MVTTHDIEIKEPTRAVVCFGFPTDATGLQVGTFFEAILDPNMLSPSGSMVRFEAPFQGGEIHGWQRVDGFTVCEILGAVKYAKEPPEGYKADPNAVLRLRAVKSWS